jgi:hypothetical protein
MKAHDAKKLKDLEAENVRGLPAPGLDLLAVAALSHLLHRWRVGDQASERWERR